MRPTVNRPPKRVQVLARPALRLLLGPLAVAIFAGIQLDNYGNTNAALAAYLAFLASQAAVIASDRMRLQRARRRLAAYRASRPRPR